jgi:hypothetical protein
MRAASAGRPNLLELEGDVLQRAHDLADRLGSDAGIERRRVEPGMTEQHLDDADINVLLEQVGGMRKIRVKPWRPSLCQPKGVRCQEMLGQIYADCLDLPGLRIRPRFKTDGLAFGDFIAFLQR